MTNKDEPYFAITLPVPNVLLYHRFIKFKILRLQLSTILSTFNLYISLKPVLHSGTKKHAARMHEPNRKFVEVHKGG